MVRKMKISSEILEVLRRLGLSKYESNAYVALVGLSAGTATEVASISGIPETSAYRALNSLVQKGFAEVSLGRPITYRAVKPELIKDKIIKQVEDAFLALEDMYGAIEREITPEIIYTIRGKDKVYTKVKELIENASTQILMSAPFEFVKSIQSILKKVRKNVTLKIITDNYPESIFSRNVEIRLDSPLFAVDLAIDSSFSLIALPDLSVSGLSDNPLVAQHFEQFLALRWTHARKVKEEKDNNKH